MWQSLHIPGTNIPIYGYGLMLVVGFFAAVHLARFLSRHCRIDPEIFSNAALIALVAGVIGARMSHVLENLGEFTDPHRSVMQNFIAMINIRSGGLTYYGGFMLAFPAVLAYGYWKKVPLRLGMDIIAPCLMVGLGFGRIGCYLNGCCYGARTDAPWASTLGTFPYLSYAYMEQAQHREIKVPPELLDNAGFPRTIDDIRHDLTLPAAERQQLLSLASAQHSLPVHPAELYSTITAWLIAFFLAAYFTFPHAPGRVFALMLVVEGITRFLLEILRVEPAVIGTWTLGMVEAIPLILLGIGLWFGFGQYAKAHQEPEAAISPALAPA